MGLLLRAVRKLAAHEKQKYEPQHEVQSREANQRKERIARADTLAVAVRSAKQAVDQPRLTTELRRHPARGRGDVRKWEGQHQDPQHWSRPLERASKSKPG